ncbi:unnamed protein product (macronuclear) [Paramecium tetraurelia]|uniref:Chromosome undetermined scaffold_80, whole genome shotgun sequence n=1 Tax=Paramecium tetraurelia TaxID=5888 RepID=Q3SDJ1_PARTE|nr:uncharacterized protein GSPATT00023876001 [Paramecium tetraurelia]CAI39367.1 rab_A24 [Paramecium tetraurelia]CAK91148.1 unnamed protein product [Paramecium tetraurelia]|eukprot:XP_001458545.1 hypothetical protein (macronuclear) [Paramecium tetraurelia strain d4-2]
MNKETVPMFKFIVVGDQSVGKSSFVKQYSESIFIETHKPTIGVEFVKKIVVVDKRRVELQIWDTAGQEQFRSMIKSFYRGAAGVFVLYGVNQRDSFEKLNEWLQELQESAHEEIVKILVGNKSDLERDVSKKEAEKFMNDNNFSLFFETSAKTGENVEKAFVEAVKLVIMRMFTSESFKNSIKTIKKTPANSRQNTSRNEPIDDVAQSSKPIQLQVTPQNQQKQEKQCC